MSTTLACEIPWNLTYYPAIEETLLNAGFDLNSNYKVRQLENGNKEYYQELPDES